MMEFSLPPDTSADKSAVSLKDTSMVNGLEDIRVCSSRSRDRRSSSRRGSMIDEGSPKHKRRSAELEERKDGGTSPASAPSRRTGGSRNMSSSDDTNKIVVDTDSILDMLMGMDGSREGEESEEEEGLSMRLKNSSPVKGKPPKPQGGKALENGLPSRKVSGNKLEAETPKRLGTSRSESSLLNPKSRAGDAKPVRPEPQSSSRDETQTELPTQRGHRNTPKHKPEEEEESSFRMRGRSNAIDMRTSSSVRSKAILAKTRSDSVHEDEPENKPSTKDKDEPVQLRRHDKTERRAARVERNSSIRSDERSSSLKRNRMSGEQALGIFYHSRRSIIDPADLEEALDRRSKERGSSTDRSESPTRTSRESRSFSPKPMSPLINQRMSFGPEAVRS